MSQEKLQDKLAEEIEEIIKSAKNVVDDYKTNPSELSSDDVVTIQYVKA